MPLWDRASGETGNTRPATPFTTRSTPSAAELELPLCINTGIPGPPIPGEVQNPIHLDRVCVRFPELKLCMIHGADPWWDIAIRLLIKYQNLRLMTSAWSPKRLPDSLLHYMRTRGPNKMIFASDCPVLRMPGWCPRRWRWISAPSAGQLSLQQRAGVLLRREPKATDGPLRTAQAGLQPVRRPCGSADRVSAFFKTTALSRRYGRPNRPDSTRACGSGCARSGATTMALPESVGRRRRHLGRPDPGSRGDRAVAGAGAVDRSRVRGPAAGPPGRAGRRDRHGAAPSSRRSTRDGRWAGSG